VIEVLASRSNFAAELLAAVEAKQIPVSDLTAFDVRQIRSLKDPALQDRVAAVWGEVRESSAAKRARIESLKQQLTAERLEGASPARGRSLFNNTCFKCHRLFGHGEDIGPDLTGANRNNIDFLLDNIVDPSAVVSRDFRMTTILTADGRMLNGLVAAKTAKTLTLQTQTDLKTIDLDDIEELERTPQSPMPDGLLDNLSEDQIRDLIAYLMQPAQVALPPGVPGKP
jgi:putative heme-binding domain-containing protein